MKTLLLMFLFGLTAILDIPEPEFAERPYVLNENNSLGNLERVDAVVDVKVRGMGYGGTESYYSAFGKKSDVRFPSTKLPRIIVKVGASVDPSELFSVSKAIIKSDRRRFLLTSRSMGGKVKNTGQVEVKLAYKKIRDGVYEISFPDGIAPGEYAFLQTGGEVSLFSASQTVKINCFGID